MGNGGKEAKEPNEDKEKWKGERGGKEAKEFIWFMAYKCAIFSLLTVRRL